MTPEVQCAFRFYFYFQPTATEAFLFIENGELGENEAMKPGATLRYV